MTQYTIFIRNETYENELRAPLIPEHVKLLIIHGYTVYVESSQTRVYPDSAYAEAGAILTNEPWYSLQYKEALIIGIKELTHLTELDHHKHLYFSHSFRKQKDSLRILNAFKNTNSIIYDVECFTDSENRRLIAFGFHAGMVAATLGLLQHCSKHAPLTEPKTNIHTLKHWTSVSAMINTAQNALSAISPLTKIAVMGAEGRTGKGIQYILDKLNIKYTKFTRDSPQDSLSTVLPTYSIIYNAISLDESYSQSWFSPKTPICTSHITIVDVSCDYTRPNNPIKLYSAPTSWLHPVYTPQTAQHIDIIAIENLPSLLPKESSDHFSDKLYHLLLDQSSDIWQNAATVFYNKSNNYT
jgi:saccharopine dehydrogenase (NAD+, L-lysine-forming)